MSSMPPPPGRDDDEQAAAAKTLLDEIGLHDVLEQGVARLREVCPRLSTPREARRVLLAQIMRGIEAQDSGGESKDDTAAETTISVFVETQVRSPVLE